MDCDKDMELVNQKNPAEETRSCRIHPDPFNVAQIDQFLRN